MAKHLKINIKNAQLAEVLKKNKQQKIEKEIKKESPSKSATKEPAVEEKKVVRARKTQSIAIPKSETPEVTKATESPKPKKTDEIKEAPVEKKAVEKVAEPPQPKKEAAPKKAAVAETTVKKPKKPEKTERPKEDLNKNKKSPSSYKRQAFSRVFNSRGGGPGSDEERWRRRRYQKSKTPKDTGPIIRPKEITVVLPITIKELSSEMKIKASQVVQKLFMQGLSLTLNDILDDPTTVELIGQEFDCQIHIDTKQEKRLQITTHTVDQEIADTDPSLLTTRPPVVTIMGHVDHGKTSIIDAFRKSNLASAEAGAITQHIGAFKCDTKHGSFTVLDTPGHAAFTEIRSRGTRVTDIVVLVIAGDEGIKPQTEEAIEKAQEADVPIIVAINKMDKQGFNPDEIYRQLADRNLLPEAWGGQIITINCSAKTKEGIDQLGEMIALQSDVLELKANPSERARGIVLESELHRGLGASATLLVQNGTLKEGDPLIFEHVYGRIKTMQDEHGKKIADATPSTAVMITGLSGVPAAGNEFIVLESEKEARKIAEERKSQLKRTQLRHTRGKDIEQLFSKKAEMHKKKILNIVLKADVGSSVEAVMSTLNAIPTDKVELNFISADVGQISESDIELAETTNSIIVGFHTNLESYAERLIKKKKITMMIRDVIYHLVDDIKAHMITLLDKVRQENEVGSAKVLALFKSSKLGVIAGCQVLDGIIKRSHFMKIFRNGEEIWKGSIASLKRNQEDVKEVKKDLECGINLDGFNDIMVDDIIRSYEVTYITQEL